MEEDEESPTRSLARRITIQIFCTSKCRLCAKERIEILKRARHKPLTLINRRKDLYEACKHKPQAHRFKDLEDSTDEA